MGEMIVSPSVVKRNGGKDKHVTSPGVNTRKSTKPLVGLWIDGSLKETRIRMTKVMALRLNDGTTGRRKRITG